MTECPETKVQASVHERAGSYMRDLMRPGREVHRQMRDALDGAAQALPGPQRDGAHGAELSRPGWSAREWMEWGRQSGADLPGFEPLDVASPDNSSRLFLFGQWNEREWREWGRRSSVRCNTEIRGRMDGIRDEDEIPVSPMMSYLIDSSNLAPTDRIGLVWDIDDQTGKDN